MNLYGCLMGKRGYYRLFPAFFPSFSLIFMFGLLLGGGLRAR
jgi:hypothetical protein